jgi:hypothetical protein
MRDTFGTALRILAIVFMSLTAAMNILGGVGTVCAAFLPGNFPPMQALMDFQWLYQALVVVTLLLGVGGVWIVVQLVRGARNGYRNALLFLFTGTLVGGIHMYASLALRGKAVPANMKLYINAFTLLVFLLLGLPGIRERVEFDSGGSEGRGAAAGLAAVTVGLMVLATSIWAGPSHVYEGVNWVHVLETPLEAAGLLLALSGLALLLWGRLRGIAAMIKEQVLAVE